MSHPPPHHPPSSEQPSPLAPATAHYKAGRLDQAEKLLRRLMRHSGKGKLPRDAPLMLATVLLEQGKFEQARFELDRQIHADPGNVELHLASARALATRHHWAEACEAFDRAAELAPGNAEVFAARGLSECEEGLPSCAEASHRRSLELEPAYATAATGLAQALVEQFRARQAVEMLRENLRAYPARANVQQMLAFLLLYCDDAVPEELFREHRLAGSLCARDVDGLPPRIMVDKDPERRLAIGYISPDFRQHSCAYFIESLLEHHDRDRFRIIAYEASKQGDDVTRRLRSCADQWRSVARLSDAELAAEIARDKVDIAIDLAGHTGGSRLAALALRPAPICINYLGYANTTGMPGIDYRIVDAVTDPTGSDSLATEKLVRLPECFLCYRPLAHAPPAAPASAGGDRPITFGSFNAPAKINPSVIEAWGRILSSVPGSRLLLKGKQFADDAVRRQVGGLFQQRGIDRGRIEARAWSPDVHDHLGLYAQVDVALDTFPYNGTTTTCEALWMGTPVVVLEGRTHAARVGVSLIRAAGILELITADGDSYARAAIALAKDRSRLASLRSTLRERIAHSTLCDGRAHAARFETVLRDVWRRWCSTR